MISLPAAGGTMAARSVVTKVLRLCQHRARSVNKSAVVFRRCFTLGIRRSLSTPETKKKGMYIADIRGLCKTRKRHEVSELFYQLLELPHQYLANSVNSALHWFLYYGKIEEAFEFKALMEKHGIPKSDSTYSTLADLYSRCSQPGNMKSFFDEMTRDGLTPRARHYAPFTDTALKKGDLIGAFHSVSEMQKSAVVHERNVDIYTALIRACAGQQNEQLMNKVLELFHEFIKYRDLLSDDTLEAVKLWFDSQAEPKWTTSWSTTSVRFHCQACEEKLQTGEFSAVELEEFKHPLATHLWRNHKAVPSVHCFTSAGYYIDHVRAGQLNNFPQSIEQFIKTTGPYDVVIDGLNVAYFKGFFDPIKLENVVMHFVKQDKRVLVVGSRPLALHSRRHGSEQTALGALMGYLTGHANCGVFCLNERTIDDVYFLSTAMHCGPGTRLVSCDQFCNHISSMDPFMKAQFRRWQKLYQMELERFTGVVPVFTTKKPFDAAAQTTGDTWHFPSSDGDRWLCVTKAGI